MMHRNPISRSLPAFARAVSVVVLLWAAPAAASVATGDRAYDARADAMAGRFAEPASIDRSIDAYEQALPGAEVPTAVQWRLLRSLYYRGDFADVSDADRRAAFVRGRALSEQQVDALTRRTGQALHDLSGAEARAALRRAGIPAADVARIYFWASVHWGAWSRDVGLLTVVTEGVANRVYEYARISAELEPAYERGGAHRMLSRLHATLPRVPFVSRLGGPLSGDPRGRERARAGAAGSRQPLPARDHAPRARAGTER